MRPYRISRCRVLTARQLQLIDGLIAGLTYREIGEQIGLSVHMVKFYLHRLYLKIGVNNRTKAAEMFAHKRTKKETMRV